MDESEKKGKSLADLLMVEMQARPLEFIKAISAYTPKEIEISDSGDISQMSEAELDDRIARLTAAVEASLGGNKPSEGKEEAHSISPPVAPGVH